MSDWTPGSLEWLAERETRAPGIWLNVHCPFYPSTQWVTDDVRFINWLDLEYGE